MTEDSAKVNEDPSPQPLSPEGRGAFGHPSLEPLSPEGRGAVADAATESQSDDRRESSGHQASRDAAQVASHKRGWMIFFGLLLFMTVAGIALEVWFNEHQRLRQGQLDRYHDLWASRGSKEYDFSYTVIDQERTPKDYTIQVRRYGSFLVESRDSESSSEAAPTSIKLAPGEVPYLSMDDLFAKIDTQLKADDEPGQPRVFAKADFDRDDGHVVRYIHSVRATRQRHEVRVKSLRRLDE